MWLVPTFHASLLFVIHTLQGDKPYELQDKDSAACNSLNLMACSNWQSVFTCRFLLKNPIKNLTGARTQFSQSEDFAGLRPKEQNEDATPHDFESVTPSNSKGYLISVSKVNLDEFVSSLKSLAGNGGPYGSTGDTSESSIESCVSTTMTAVTGNKYPIRELFIENLGNQKKKQAKAKKSAKQDEPSGLLQQKQSDANAIYEELKAQFIAANESLVHIYEISDYGSFPFFKFHEIMWDYGFIAVDSSGHYVQMCMTTDCD